MYVSLIKSDVHTKVDKLVRIYSNHTNCNEQTHGGSDMSIIYLTDSICYTIFVYLLKFRSSVSNFLYC